MITIEEAVNAAFKFLDQIPSLKKVREDVSLEEVELAEEKTYEIWKITLGFPTNASLLNPLAVHRTYKVFFVNAQTGVVKKMKMREENSNVK